MIEFFTDLLAVGKFGADLFLDLFLPQKFRYISLSYISSGPTNQLVTNDLVSPTELCQALPQNVATHLHESMVTMR